MIEARYFDGASAAEKHVTVDLHADYMLVSGDASLRWAYRDLEVVAFSHEGDNVTITNRSNRDRRIAFTGKDDIDLLLAAAPQLVRQRPGRGILKPLGVFAAIVLVIGVLYSVYPPMKKVAIVFIPDSWVISTGEVMAESIVGYGGFCSSEEGDQVLTELVDRLSADHNFRFPIAVRVANRHMVNAFAVPGGQIVLLRGLLEKAETPDEVAGVLAHEMGHVKHGHALERMVDLFGLELFFSSVGGDLGAVATTLALFKYSRDDEREADAMALEFLQGAKISAEGFAQFFARLNSGDLFFTDDSDQPEDSEDAVESAELGGDEDGDIDEQTSQPSSRAPSTRLDWDFLDFLSTHPPTDEREDRARAAVADLALSPSLSASEWQALRTICDEPEDRSEEDIIDGATDDEGLEADGE